MAGRFDFDTENDDAISHVQQPLIDGAAPDKKKRSHREDRIDDAIGAVARELLAVVCVAAGR